MQMEYSAIVTRCLRAPIPAKSFGLVFRNASTFVVTFSNAVQCFRMSLGGSKLPPPQRFSVVLSNASAMEVHVAQVELCLIKALRCSQPIKRSRLGAILRKSSLTPIMQLAERELTVSAAPP